MTNKPRSRWDSIRNLTAPERQELFDAMEENHERARESMLRRKARQQGFRLIKRRGGWLIIDAERNVIVAGDNNIRLSTDEVEAYLE